jgi:protein phosphatase
MIEIAYGSDIGRVRDLDEDSIAVVRIDTLYSSRKKEYVLLVLADGLGGHNAGEIASSLGIKTVAEFISKVLVSVNNGNYSELLKSAISEANNAIFNYAIENPECHGMGTTIVAAIIDRDNLHAGNVGDSRLYIINKKDIRQITVDHTLSNGTLSRAVGVSPSIEADTFETKIIGGDTILICCDGLTDVVEGNVVMNTVLRNNAADACNKLIELANEAGGPDNISVIIAKMQE